MEEPIKLIYKNVKGIVLGVCRLYWGCGLEGGHNQLCPIIPYEL